MEYCSGQTLEDKLNKRNVIEGFGFIENGGPIDRNQNLKIFSQIINGMVEIHKNDVIHRDLKPENIFIENGTAKIGDFGLARTLTKTDETDNRSTMATSQGSFENSLKLPS